MENKMKQEYTKVKKQEEIKRQEIKVGECFKHGSTYYMRVFPVKTLHNSHLIRDVVNREDYFAVNLKNGTLTVLPSNLTYTEIEASFKVKGE